MFKSSTYNPRKYYRWHFNTSEKPQEKHSKGVAVTLAGRWPFGGTICHAVVKDISLGGAGVLVPSTKKVPGRVTVIYEDSTRLKAQVVYRRQINDQLTFLGLNWTSSAYQQKLALLRKISKKAYRPARTENKAYGTTKQA